MLFVLLASWSSSPAEADTLDDAESAWASGSEREAAGLLLDYLLQEDVDAENVLGASRLAIRLDTTVLEDRELALRRVSREAKCWVLARLWEALRERIRGELDEEDCDARGAPAGRPRTFLSRLSGFPTRHESCGGYAVHPKRGSWPPVRVRPR